MNGDTRMSDTKNLERLSGQIERVTYTNVDNGYTIARVKVYGRRDLVTVVGNLVDPLPEHGSTIRVTASNSRLFFTKRPYRQPCTALKNIWLPA